MSTDGEAAAPSGAGRGAGAGSGGVGSDTTAAGAVTSNSSTKVSDLSDDVVQAVRAGGSVKLAFKGLGNAVDGRPDGTTPCPALAELIGSTIDAGDGSNISALDLSCNSLGGDGVQALAAAIAALPSVR